MKFNKAFILILLLAVVACPSHLVLSQNVAKLVEKAGFKSLKLGMSLDDVLLTVRSGQMRVVKQDRIYRFERSSLNSIGNYPINSVTLQFKDRVLAEIKLHIEGSPNIKGVFEAIKLAYGPPKVVPFENTDSLAFQGNKVFVWLPQEISNADNGTSRTKVNAVLCTVTSYRWDGGKIILDYNIFAADHYSLAFSTMVIYDEQMMGYLRQNNSEFIRFQKASEDL